jgi:hypothetical protein
MIINFKTCKINRDTRKLARIPTLIKKNCSNNCSQEKTSAGFRQASGGSERIVMGKWFPVLFGRVMDLVPVSP